MEEIKIGRPTIFSQELCDSICEKIMEGESLRQICKDESMPAKATLCRWLVENQAFKDQYENAKEFQAEYMADEILQIADDGKNDYMEKSDSAGFLLNSENIQRSRLRVDARKWVAAKLLPKKYGERIAQDITANVTSNVIVLTQDEVNKSKSKLIEELDE